MLGNSEMQEISEGKRENEVVKSQKVEGSIEEREIERKELEEDGVVVAVAERNSPANRWPQQETMALLRIRSEMDAAFREAVPGCKATLWDEVSRYNIYFQFTTLPLGASKVTPAFLDRRGKERSDVE